MTTEQIVTAYLEREKAQSATQEGQDIRAICEEVAALAGITWRDVHSIVIEQTLLGAC